LEAGNQYESLAGAYSGLAKYDRAETMQREALRLSRKALTNNPSALAEKILELARVLARQNRSTEVDQLASEAVNLIGREPSPIVDTGSALTRLQMLAGEKASNDPEGALRLYRQGADLTRRMPLLKDSGLLVDFVARTRIQLVRLDRWKEAEPTARQAVELTAKVYGGTNCLGARMELAGVLEHLDKLAEAEALYRQVAAGLVPLANDAPGEFNRFISGQGRYRPLDNDPFGKLSRLLLAQGRRVEAERALLDGWSKLQVYPRTTAQQTCEAGQRVLEFYEAWDATAPAAGKAAKVALWKQKLAAFNRAMAENTP
jgi:tetratricopeptide (TPR) repeat protein